MQRKRLNKRQKVQAVANLLLNSMYQKSAYEMGRELGFVNGIPLYDALCALHSMGFVEVIQSEHLNKPATYFKVLENQKAALRSWLNSDA